MLDFSTGCPGVHCPGCGRHGGGGLLALVVVLAVAAAIRAAWHAIVTALEITAYVAASIAAAAMLAGAAYAAVRIRRHVLEVRARRISPQVRAVITDVKAGRPVAIPRPVARLAIEAPRKRPDGWPLPGQRGEIRTQSAASNGGKP
jgi:hypothetical protein